MYGWNNVKEGYENVNFFFSSGIHSSRAAARLPFQRLGRRSLDRHSIRNSIKYFVELIFYHLIFIPGV